MSTTIENTKTWLEKIEQHLEIEEKFGKGRKIANLLDVNTSTISKQKQGNLEMQTDQATKTARLLGVLPMLVISSTSYHRCLKEKEYENAEMWKKVYEKTSREQAEQMELENGIA